VETLERPRATDVVGVSHRVGSLRRGLVLACCFSLAFWGLLLVATVDLAT
jgi:hypothetical protein